MRSYRREREGVGEKEKELRKEGKKDRKEREGVEQ